MINAEKPVRDACDGASTRLDSQPRIRTNIGVHISAVKAQQKHMSKTVRNLVAEGHRSRHQ